MSEGNGKDDEDDSESETFANLIGDTQRIARGPERVQTPSRKLPATRSTDSSEPSARFRFPDSSDRCYGAASGVSDRQLLSLKRAEREPEERIDLHGLRREAAERLIRDRIKSARVRGLRSIIVIHGQGQRSDAGVAVLREALPDWLSTSPCAPHVLAFAPAPSRLGGRGATLVLLRRPD